MDFHNYVDREKRKRAKDGVLKGKRICFSHFLLNDLENAKKMVADMFALGGFYSFHAEDCDWYVYPQGETGARIKSAERCKAKLVEVEEFSAFLQKSL